VEPVRSSAAPKVARCAQAARAGCPDDSHQAFPYLVGSVRASAHWAAADLGRADCLAELMADDPHAMETDWAAPTPDGCSEQAGLRQAGSAGRMADDHCAPVGHPVPGERSADSALDDSAAPKVDDPCVPAAHPVAGERSADSALDDSVVLMMGDRCAPAVHPVPGERSVRADSVAAGYSENCFQADC
jgi:hypothetical protein